MTKNKSQDAMVSHLCIPPIPDHPVGTPCSVCNEIIKPQENWIKAFDNEFTNPNTPELWRDVKSFIEKTLNSALEKQREEIIEQLIIIRDAELKDKPMLQNRAAYNTNLLIDSLKESEERK